MSEMDYKVIVPNIRRKMGIIGMEVPELAAAMRCSTATVYNRFRKPEAFTLSELGTICKKLSMSEDELFKK